MITIKNINPITKKSEFDFFRPKNIKIIAIIKNSAAISINIIMKILLMRKLLIHL